jgi:type II secretory pathway pseudopilin PulG
MLIVIAIIGILASIVLVGLGPIQRQGRDARRQSDLRNVQNALELYFNKCGHYPGTSDCSGAIGNPSWTEMGNALKGASIGINQIPNDPSSGKSYFYGTDSDGSTYILGADLEDDNNRSLTDDVDGNVQGVDCADPVYCIEF